MFLLTNFSMMIVYYVKNMLSLYPFYGLGAQTFSLLWYKFMFFLYFACLLDECCWLLNNFVMFFIGI